MRLIGHLPDEPSARTFGDFLYARGIQNQLEHQKADGWGVWVAEEDKIGEATDLLALFRANPGDPKYRKVAKSADQLRAEEEKDQTKYRQRVRERKDLFRPLRGYGFGPLTCVLIAVSVVVGVLTRLGVDSPLLRSLLIADPFSSSLSNLAQFFVRGPIFGGMSGVIYGLFGYIWIRGRFDPASGLFLPQTTVTMMIIWFILCAVNVIPNVANYAHGAGLLLGMAWGYLSSLHHR
jgi:hypothetical protein